MNSMFVHGPSGKIDIVFANPNKNVMAIFLPSNETEEINSEIFSIFEQEGLGVVQINYNNSPVQSQLIDISSCLNIVSTQYQNFNTWIVVGYGYGAFLGMQLLMRRPEITHFIMINTHIVEDFSFLAPCPIPGILIQSAHEPKCDIEKSKILADSLTRKKKFDIKLEIIDSDYKFTYNKDNLSKVIQDYLHQYIIK